MRRLLSLIALCLALVLGATPSFAADAGHGAQIFSANCAACHMGGGNVVNVVYDATALKMWVTYAKGTEEAYQRPSVLIDLQRAAGVGTQSEKPVAVP